MKIKQYFKITIVLSCILLMSHSAFAQETQIQYQDDQSSQSANNQTSDNYSNSAQQTNMPDNEQASQSDYQSSNGVQSSQNQQNSNTQNTQTNPDNSANKQNSNPQFDFKNLGWNQLNPNANKENATDKDAENKTNLPTSSRLGFNFSTMLAILGLAGTFLGIFSTWLIYHLNRKNNNPLIVDKKDSAIKYIEELYKIKDLLTTNKIQKLDNMLVSSNINELKSSKAHEFISLISAYTKISIEISEVDLTTAHDRYQKHIKENKYKLFKSLMSCYSTIQTEGVYYSNNSNLINYHNIQSDNFLNEENLRKLRMKVLNLLNFEDKIDIILRILNKELK